MRKQFKGLIGRLVRSCAAVSTATPRHALVLMLHSVGLAAPVVAAIPASERAALTSFYTSTNGASWTTRTNWNGGAGTECSWYGIQCDSAQAHVTGINLGLNNLVGSLPSLGRLTALQSVSLINNQLTGTISWISGLTALKSFLAWSNQLTGTIPALSALTALQVFEVSRNNLSGAVPAAPPNLAASLSSLCSNNLASGGSAAIDATWIASAGYWLACQKVQTVFAPTCTVTATPPTISAGHSSQLTISCTPAAAYFDWGNAGFPSTFTSGTVSPSVSTTYYARGINAAGLGNPANVTVTVTPPPPSKPICTLTATPASISAGGTSTLTASCSPAATSYSWTGGGCVGTSSASCTVTPAATTTYTVIGGNAGGTGAAASATVTVTSTASGQVVEFYNANLDNYFITADPGEAAAIDKGSAGPGWSRTGNVFASGGSTPVCRFYGSQSPGPNSHFYTLAGTECDGLKQLQAATPASEKRWNFESLDFSSTRENNGICPGGTVPVYRAYNKGFARGVDSNHRITTSLTAIQAVVARGWSNEGVVMCAPSSTGGGTGSAVKGAYCSLTVVSGSLSAAAGSSVVMRADCTGESTQTLWYANNWSSSLPQNNYYLIGTGSSITIQVPQPIGNTSSAANPFDWMLVAKNAYGAHAIRWQAWPITAKIPKQSTCSHIEVTPPNLYSSDGVTRQLDISGVCDASASYTASYGTCETAGSSDMTTPHRSFDWTVYPNYPNYDASKTDEYFLRDCSSSNIGHKSFYSIQPGNGGYPNPAGYGFQYILLNGLTFPN